jgi:glycosyltransferase involved in cell wall biosynthesis
MTEPLVSVVLPTLNAERYLPECLDALLAQDWPRERLEILVVDAGSSDRTRAIAGERRVDRILDNPLRTAEAGKAVGLRAARGELVCSVDSDNVVVGSDWLRRMTAPFSDPTVIGAEVARFDYRRGDGCINRWHALSGVADPLTLYTGNFARDSLLRGTWTLLPHDTEQREGWERITLRPGAVPVLGANGFLLRRDVALRAVPVGTYHFDLDYVAELVEAGYPVFARVDASVRHYFCDGPGQYVRKTRRRAEDFFYFRSEGRRSYPWAQRRQLGGVVRFIASSLLVVPLLLDVARGMRRRPDRAWLWHPVACWITLAVYAEATIRGALRPRSHDRSNWRQ